MSGETEQQVSAWTTDVLKHHVDAMRQQDQRYDDAVRAADQRLADERWKHQEQLRAADQLAIDAVQRYNDAHFEQLNKNAERTIEERGHFVTHDSFDPFQKQVLEALNTTSGRSIGANQAWAYLVAAAGVITGLALYLH